MTGDRTTPSGICEKCGASRALGIPAYHPIQYVTGQPLGWYWGPAEGVELCGPCLTGMLAEVNGPREDDGR